MKKIILGTMGMTMLITGCRVISPKYPVEDDSIAVMELGEKFVGSFAEDDSQQFLLCLSPEAKHSLNEEKFVNSYREITKKFGSVKHYELLGELENPVYQIQLWKIRYEKNQLVNDMLFRVLMAKIDGKMQVVSFAFL